MVENALQLSVFMVQSLHGAGPTVVLGRGNSSTIRGKLCSVLAAERDAVCEA